MKIIKQTLTGYVAKKEYEVFEKYKKPFHERKIDVSYRARQLPFYLGKGGLEKGAIARFVKNNLNKTKLKADISLRDKDRLYGDDWAKLLGNSRFTLGVEAGCSVVDITGKLKSRVEKYQKDNPNCDFDDVNKDILKSLDGNVNYRTISPRFFESAALGAIPIMFTGRYNGILKASENYIELTKDFSNWNKVLAQMSNSDVCNLILENNSKLLLSDDLSYANFIKKFDKVLSANRKTNT